MQPQMQRIGTWFSSVGFYRRWVLWVSRSIFLSPKFVSVMNPGVVGECEPRIGAGRAPGAVKDRLCPTDGDAVI